MNDPHRPPLSSALSREFARLRDRAAALLLGKRREPVADGRDAFRIAPIGADIIAEACRRVGVRHPLRRDFNGRTVHAIVTGADGAKAWLKISGNAGDTPDPYHEAEVEADGLLTVPKPRVVARSEWARDGVRWRAALMAMAPSEAAARHPWRAPALSNIPERWFSDLRDALRALQGVRTSRFICTPAEISTAIKTYLPEGFPTETDAWYVQHGDLHWGNVTLPHLSLLDWEVWGLAPASYGAGRLLTFSLLVPEVARKLEATFAHEFSTPSGRIGVIAAIAIVKKQAEASAAPEDLYARIEELIDRIQTGDFASVRQPPDPASALEA